MTRDIRRINLAVFLWGAGEGLFLTIQPLYIEQLGANPAQIGGVLALIPLAAGLTYIPAGYLADRLPRKPLMVGGWTAGLVAVLISALARDWRALIPGLVLYGLSAYCVPIINAYLAAAAGGRDLERIYTTNIGLYTAGAVLAPAAGGLLAQTFSMRVVYLAASGLLALSTATVLGISPQQVPAPGNRRVEWGLVHSRRMAGFAMLVLFAFFSMYLIFPLAPNFLVDTQGLSTAQVGTLGSLSAIGTTLLSLGLGRLRGRQRRRGLPLGQVLVGLSAALLLWAPGIGWAALAFLLRGAYQACRALAQAHAGNLAEEAYRGLALGTTQTAIAAAELTAAVAAGWLYAGQSTWPFLAAVVLAPISILFTTVVLARPRQVHPPVPDGCSSPASG